MYTTNVIPKRPAETSGSGILKTCSKLYFLHFSNFGPIRSLVYLSDLLVRHFLVLGVEGYEPLRHLSVDCLSDTDKLTSVVLLGLERLSSVTPACVSTAV